MEGLLPIIFAALWIIFGGIGSKKKREDAARRQRELAQRTAREREAQRAQRLEKRRADSAVRTAAERAREEAREARASVQESSVDMIPDELWNILTGGAPRPPRSQQPSGGGWTTSPPWDEEDAVHSIAGVSTEGEFGDETDSDDEAISHARCRQRLEGSSPSPGMRRTAGARAPAVCVSGLARPSRRAFISPP